MKSVPEISENTKSAWNISTNEFKQWVEDWKQYLLPSGLSPEPTIKVLIFLALLEADKPCSYDDLRNIFKLKKIIKGKLSDNTLRTSVLNLGKTLEKANHKYTLKSLRGTFEIIEREMSKKPDNYERTNSVVLLLEPSAIKAEEIAFDLMKKAALPFHSLYFLEWSARWWEIFSSSEAEIRASYEAGSWERLGINNRLYRKNVNVLSFVSLAPGEGLAEIEILKKMLAEKDHTIHYLAIDSSQKLLRDHINLLKEILASEIEKGRLICAGVVANIFSNLHESVLRIKKEYFNRGISKDLDDFLPTSSGLLVTYFGNCLGNGNHDQESEFFSTMHSVFQNRPLEVLVGVSVMRSTPDIYKRNWDGFLLHTLRHLLETKQLLKSNKSESDNITEFVLPNEGDEYRCPPVVPESYMARHQIEGQIYRFHYRLAYDLSLSTELSSLKPLPKGALILLYNIIKYNIKSLVDGVGKCGLFKVSYDEMYTKIIDTPNGIREYAVFSAFSEK